MPGRIAGGTKAARSLPLQLFFFAVILSTVTASLQKGVFENLVENVVSFYTGYIQVHKNGYQEEQILDNGFQRTTLLESNILAARNIRSISPRLESFALTSSGEMTKGCMICGIAPEQENSITALKAKLVKGEYLSDNDQAILIAEGLAKRLSLNVNDTIILIGQGYHGATAANRYRIKGLLKFGSPQLNDKILYMSLSASQEFFSAEGLLTSYVLSVADPGKLDQTAAGIRDMTGSDKEVLTWEELLPDIKQHISSDANNMKAIQGILYLLICFGIFSTLMMMVLERKFEMGMLVAIGMKKHRLMLLFITESVITVLIGCLLAIMACVPLLSYLKKYPIRFGGETARAYERFGFEAIFPASTDSSIFISQAMIALFIGLALSMYPVIKVWRLDPVKAMKR